MTAGVLVRCQGCKRPVRRGRWCSCGAGPTAQVRTLLANVEAEVAAVADVAVKRRLSHPSVDWVWPVRCKFCRHVHDQAGQDSAGRYLDCSTWRCPGCSVLLDDRPLSMGGSAIRVRWVDSANGGYWEDRL